MKKFIASLLLSLTLLVGCSVHKEIPPTPVRVVKVSDIAPLPDETLMKQSPPVKYLTPGMTNGQVSEVLRYNNVRAGYIEIQRDQLQKFVCTIYKPVIKSTVCNTD